MTVIVLIISTYVLLSKTMSLRKSINELGVKKNYQSKKITTK